MCIRDIYTNILSLLVVHSIDLLFLLIKRHHTFIPVDSN